MRVWRQWCRFRLAALEQIVYDGARRRRRANEKFAPRDLRSGFQAHRDQRRAGATKRCLPASFSALEGRSGCLDRPARRRFVGIRSGSARCRRRERRGPCWRFRREVVAFLAARDRGNALEMRCIASNLMRLAEECSRRRTLAQAYLGDANRRLGHNRRAARVRSRSSASGARISLLETDRSRRRSRCPDSCCKIRRSPQAEALASPALASGANCAASKAWRARCAAVLCSNAHRGSLARRVLTRARLVAGAMRSSVFCRLKTAFWRPISSFNRHTALGAAWTGRSPKCSTSVCA